MLSSNIILTAAHCSALIRVDDAYIVLGDRSKVEKENREQIIDLADSQWINHPGYDPKDEYRLDYAIIKLVKPVKFTDYVIPVCLPNSKMNKYENVRATASGWGLLKYDGNVPDVLQKVNFDQFQNQDNVLSFCLGRSNHHAQ